MKTVISIIALILLVIAMWLAMIIGLTSRGPYIVDCSLASFHPDFTPEMRKACNTRFIKQ